MVERVLHSIPGSYPIGVEEFLEGEMRTGDMESTNPEWPDVFVIDHDEGDCLMVTSGLQGLWSGGV